MKLIKAINGEVGKTFVRLYEAPEDGKLILCVSFGETAAHASYAKLPDNDVSQLIAELQDFLKRKNERQIRTTEDPNK